jgi:ABC-type uncharacterized transport system permease subunit
MERWYLGLATVLVVLGGALGARAVHRGKHSPWTLWFMAGCFVMQLLALGERGEMRGQCPLGDFGEILLFLAWSLVLFYLLVGPTYRLSLLGLFTAPVVAVFQLIALVPGMMETEVVRATEVDAWRETHAATSVLSYGAFALAAVAGMMFIVLNKQLKLAHLSTGLFKNLPPASTLIASVVRLVWLGLAVMTAGMVSGYLMAGKTGGAHLTVARAVWVAYFGLMLIHHWRGITPRRFCVVVILFFLGSLGVFAFL